MVGERGFKYRGIASQMMDRLSVDYTEYAVISGVGHCAHLEGMAESAHILTQWLKRLFT